MADSDQGLSVETLLTLARDLAELGEPGEVYQRVAEVIVAVMAVDASASLVVDRGRGVLRVEGASGWPPSLAAAVDAFEVPLDASPLLEQLVDRPEPFYATPDLDDPLIRAVLEEFETNAALVVPIEAHGTVIGLVAGVKRGPSKERLAPAMTRTLQGLADQAATAIDNARLYAVVREQLTAAQEMGRLAKEAHDTLEHVLASGPVVTFRGTTDGFRITYVSQNVETLFGYDADTFLEQRWLNFVHPDDVEHVWASTQRLLDEADVETGLRFLDATGTYRWLRLHLRGDVSQPAEHREVLGYVWDESEQREAEERYRQVSELTSDLAYGYHLDASGQAVIDWSTEGMDRLTGYSVDEASAIGGWRGMIVPEDLPAYEDRIGRVLAGEHVVEEFRVRTKTGEIRVLEISATPAAAAEGEVRVCGAVRDVTDRRQALDRLAERERQLREAQSVAGVGSWRIELDRGIVEWSGEMAAMFGFDEVRVPVGRLTEMILPDDRPLLGAAADRARTTGVPADCELRFVRPDGVVRWMYTQIDVETDGDGNITAAKGATQDVTERHRAEEYFRVISDAVSDVAFAYSISAGGLVLDWVSDAWERLTGYPTPAGPGAELFVPIVHPDDLPLVRASEAAVLAGERTVDEFRVRTLDGSSRWLRIYAIPVLHDLTGDVVRVYGAAQDVTERRQAEDAVAESEARLSQLIEASPLAIMVFEPGARISMMNPAAEALFGWSLAEVLARDGRPQWVPPDRQDEFKVLARRVAGGDRVTDFETQRLHRDGSVIDVALSIAPLDRGPGQAPGAVTVLADRRERRRLEDELRQAQKMTAIGRLAGGVAHDFNNVLTTILGHAEFLNTDPVSESMVREHARAITGAGEQAAALTEQLLLLSRHRAPIAEVFDLRDEVRDMHALLSRLIGEDIAYDVDTGANACFVRAPKAHIQQIMLNLVVNARDAMPAGGRLRVATRFEPAVAGGSPSVVLAVSDTGEGMDAETRGQIFEPFFTTKSTGNGLGLSVVYGIVDNSDGEIGVESEPGGGTVIEIRFPEALGPVSPVGPPERAEARIEPVEPPGSTSILLVENETDVRHVTATALNRRGFEVIEATDALEALTLADDPTLSVDVVVTDVVMPHMGGVELAERLARRWPEVRVLLVSGYSEQGADAQGAVPAGASFLQKPFTPDELLAAVARLLAGVSADLD